MDYENIKFEFIKSVDAYLRMLNKVEDSESREKILHSMFKFISVKKNIIVLDNCVNLKNVIHERLFEFFFKYNLLWANDLYYDIFGVYIINPFPPKMNNIDELSSIIMDPRSEFDIFPIDKNYTPETCFLDKTEDDKYMNNLIHEYFSTSVFSDDIFN